MPKKFFKVKSKPKKQGVKMERCPYCNEFMEISKNSPECTHLSIDPENEFCCPNCDAHFDSDLNEVPIDDIGIARPKPPSQNPSQESSAEPSTKPSTDKPTTPTSPPHTTISPEIDSILTPPPSKIQASIKVINAIDSLRQYLQSLR